jgi:hypothetical protein
MEEEHLKQLCEQASIEQDPEKLLALVSEISILLERREGREKNPLENKNAPGDEA